MIVTNKSVINGDGYTIQFFEYNNCLYVAHLEYGGVYKRTGMYTTVEEARNEIQSFLDILFQVRVAA
ncbi:MAG: hypothetical protein ACYC2U_04670 [Candidatus Amoebophilus sp.]